MAIAGYLQTFPGGTAAAAAASAGRRAGRRVLQRGLRPLLHDRRRRRDRRARRRRVRRRVRAHRPPVQRVDAPEAGTVPVCRFFTTPGTFGAKSSHFYTANPVECDGLKLNPNWIYEKIAFHIAVPAAGACAGRHGAGLPDVQRRPDRRAEPPVHDRPRALPAVHDDAGLAARGHRVLRACRA